MIDILKEEKQEIRDYPEFLTGERSSMLFRMFCGKRSKGKLMIEVGIQKLKLVKIEKREANNGQPMMALSFWKPPVEVPHLKNKLAYNTIECRHMLQPKRTKSFKDNWFLPFTSCLDEKSFTVLEKNKFYLCLVQQDEERFFKGAEVLKYTRGRNVGEDIILVKSHIVKVLPPDTNIENFNIDYFNLYKFLE